MAWLARLGSVLSGYSVVTNATSTYGPLTTDEMILANATGGSFTINLPTAVGILGKWYVIKKIDGTANVVTVDGYLAETIDGATTVVLHIKEACAIMSDGTNWILLTI